MMTEYSGREEVVIGHLSTMLAAKNRESAGGATDGAEFVLAVVLAFSWGA